MSEIALGAICVNYASKVQSADAAEAQRETSAQSGLNCPPQKSSSSNPLASAADARRVLLSQLSRAGGAVPVSPLGSAATVASNRRVGQEHARSPQAKSGRMTPHLRRALKIRVAALEAEQAAAAAELENSLERVDAILAEMADRQRRLRSFRELLLNSGEPANSTWLPDQGGGR